MSESPVKRSRRSSGARGNARAARHAARSEQHAPMLPTLKRVLRPVEPLNAEQIEQIHQASLQVLEQTGIDFRDPQALIDWREAGARIEQERVYLDRDLLMELIATVPERFTLHARNPAHSVEVGGDATIFVPMTGAPYIRDLDFERRHGQLEDLNNFHKLAHSAPALHSSAHVICEPMDIAVAHRHLHITYSSIVHSDKTFMGMTTGAVNAEDVMAMVKILFGEDYVDQHPVVVGNINANSPLVWDETMLGALRAFSRHNQPVLCSPFVLAGANTPASTVPAVVQLNAEALAGLAYTQVVRRGAPAIYGHYLSTVSMQSGAPMAGTPEISLMNFMVGQMARFYKVPWRTSSLLGGSKTFDAQAGYESASTLMATVLAGANYIWHSAGWDEAGLVCSMPKFVVDAEQCAMAYRMMEGPRWDDFEEAVAAINDVGPGGHYMGEAHTLRNFERAFFMPQLFDNNNIEKWLAQGSKDIVVRAAEYARRQIAEYQQPPLDEGIDEALKAFIAKRESELEDEFG